MLYVLILLVISIASFPVFYMKLLVNGFYEIIVIRKPTFSSVSYYIGHFFFVMLTGPFVIVLSLLTDLINLSALLQMEEKHFEYKYQR